MSVRRTCPKCGTPTFNIAVKTWARVRFNDVGAEDPHEVVEVDGSIEWDDNSVAQCVNCDFTGPLQGMEQT